MVNIPEHLSILQSGMPADKATRSQTYPWGHTLSITRLGGSYRDLAAQSTNFAWTLSDQDGNVIKTGKFTAIGGLSGSFESCYYPIVRKIESSLVGTIYMKRPWLLRFLVIEPQSKMVIAVERTSYHRDFKWLEQPIPLPPNTEIDGNNRYLNVSEEYFNRVTASVEKEVLV